MEDWGWRNTGSVSVETNTMIDLIWGVSGKYPALKEGQNIHKNRVPIIANVIEVEFD